LIDFLFEDLNYRRIYSKNNQKKIKKQKSKKKVISCKMLTYLYAIPSVTSEIVVVKVKI